MVTYVIQTQWTEQGIRAMKESPKRLDAGKKKLKDMGGELKAFYMTLGEYDSLAIVEAPMMRRLQDIYCGSAHKEISERIR
jgi:uncharacterized protein with GYD domain